ncbi:hypothetical protein GGR51DRAFT_508704 [Nemania sp. FL0031]|nr:hypothetical protein GGR51DRAFT_508704 [Nemania sp. FL0031]
MDMQDDIVVFKLNAVDGDGADVIFDINGQRLAVSIFLSYLPKHSSRFLEKQQLLRDNIINLTSRAVSTADDGEFERIMDDVLGIILDARKAVFSKVALPKRPLSRPSHQDLHSFLYPQTLSFRLEATSHRATIILIDPKDSFLYLS